MVKCLVKELGANVNNDDRGFTPLIVAAQEEHLDVVRWLV
jgi:ankyrin repeat protein